METLKLFTPTQIEKLEKRAIKTQGLTQDILMENAAHAMFRVISHRFTNYPVIVVCGPGNNGKDGLVLARILDSEGWDVKIIDLYNRPKYTPCNHIKVIKDSDLILNSKTLIIDALFGIGINRTLDKKSIDIITNINKSKATVLSVDIPSGVDGLTGEIWGIEAINADITVTFLALKLGQYQFPGASYCGEIIVSPISVASEFINEFTTPIINNPNKLLEKAYDAHKCSQGKNLTIAGSKKYYGAAYFAAKSSLLVGSGYSRLITPDSIASVCATFAPEVIYTVEEDIQKSLSDSTSVIFGPGVGLDERGKKLLDITLNFNPSNLILDADGLTLVSKEIRLLNRMTNLFVITPHPGEMAKLVGKTINEVEKNRIKYSSDFSKQYNCIVVLKGVFTVIAIPNGEVFINNCSSVTLATAGSGDILCGIISGLTGFTDLINAVKAGVYIHGLSGKICEEEIGTIGATSSDILKSIPKAMKEFFKMKNSN